MGLVVKRPDGSTVQPGDSGVQYLYDSTNGDKYYRITTPPAGNWSVSVSYSGATRLNYSMQVHAAASDVIVSASTNKDNYTYPEPILVQATVLAGDRVAGAEVIADVVRPNWVSKRLVLYDDGRMEHGDLWANDGIYSNFFSDFTGDGSYTFNIVVNNQDGYTNERSEEGHVFVSQPVDKFVRKTQITVVVNGAPPNNYGKVYLPVVIKGTSADPSGGFNSQFNGSATGWEAHSGIWTVDSNYYSTTGLAGTSSSTSYAANFANLDYQVRLRRSGSATSNANRIMVRGTPSPLDSNNYWYNYYSFQYTGNGSYSVWKRVASVSSVALQCWTSSTAIKQGDA